MVQATLTVEEAARVLKRQPRTIRKWIAFGRIRANKIGRSYVIPESEVDKLVTVKVEPRDEVLEYDPMRMERLKQLQEALKGFTMKDYEEYTKQALASMEAHMKGNPA